MSRFSSRYNNNETEDAFRPQLTSLIDVMTILLVFLIQNFSVDGNLISPPKDIHLPISSIEKRPEITATVNVTKSDINVDGKSIIALDSIGDSLTITPLLQTLEEIKKRENSSKITLQADRDVLFEVIKKVVFTCNKAGFKDFAVLVYEDK